MVTSSYEFHEVVYIWPKMQPSEFIELVNDIKVNGLREPIWTYQGKIIDGRNRYLACKEAGIEPRYQEWDGKGSLILFVASLNQHRRHLDAGQRAMVAVGIEKHLAEEAKLNMSLGGGDKKSEQAKSGFEIVQKPIRPMHAAKEAAKIAGTNEHYVIDAKKIDEKAPELKPLVMNRVISLPDAKKLAKETDEDRKALVNKVISGQAKNVKEAKTIHKRDKLVEKANAIILPPDIQLLHGDFREAGRNIADNSVSLIFTDPPYHEKHLELWSDLGSFAARVLKPGGMLLAYSGQTALPQVLSALTEHLDYCWLLGQFHSGQHLQIWKYQIWNEWKPLVLFSKGKPVLNDWFIDAYTGIKGDKDAHEWAQSEDEAQYFIQKLTQPGKLVVDPMCGSGPIVRMAHRFKRRSVEIEIEKQRYDVALGSMEVEEVPA